MPSKGLTYDQIETAFSHQNFKPLYLLYGTERFLMDELQKRLLENALQPHEKDFNLDIVYGADLDVSQLLGLCASYPVMAQRRVIIVRNFEQVKDNKRFAAYAEQPNPSAVVLLVCSRKPNMSSHPYRALKEKAEWAEFKPLYQNQISGWISKRMEIKGLRATPEALGMLGDFLGTDLQSIESEIEKLSAYCGVRKNITGDDVVSASGQTREFNVFELQRAIGEKRYSDAVLITERLLHQATNKRSEALMIVSILTSYFTKLWKLTYLQPRQMPEKSLAQRVGVSPYFIKQYILSLQLFNRAEIAHAFASLLSADYELKGGATRNAQLILTLLIRRLVPDAATSVHTKTAVSR